MLLTSSIFFLFVAITLGLYFLLPPKRHWILLLLASYLFCFSQNYQSVLVLLLITSINYFFGLKIGNQTTERYKKKWFYISLLVNVLSLFFFKYIVFSFGNNTFYLTRATTQAEHIFIVAGISYYFLQCVSYQNDIRLELIKPEIHFGKFSLYLAFFPKLLAGPIESPERFLNQISIERKFDLDNFVYGVQRIMMGVFKKLVLADRLNIIVGNVFDIYDSASGLSLIVVIYLFTIQLYFDLSAYADIAIGTARLFGFNLTENFNIPFLATSVTNFWRRWHISLINWLTTYVYYPITYHFRKRNKNAIMIGILITFFISGIWHGLGLNFLLWGTLYAVYMLFELITQKKRNKIFAHIPKFIMQPVYVIITFNIVVFTNLLIRFSNVTDVAKIIKRLFTFEGFVPQDIFWDFIWQLSKKGELEYTFYTLITIVVTIVFLLFEMVENRKRKSQKIRFLKIFILAIMIVLFGVFINSDQFLYVIY